MRNLGKSTILEKQDRIRWHQQQIAEAAIAPEIPQLCDLLSRAALTHRVAEPRSAGCDVHDAAPAELDNYHLWIRRADMLRLVSNDSERRFLEQMLREVQTPAI